jgi:hypothetical protein
MYIMLNNEIAPVREGALRQSSSTSPLRWPTGGDYSSTIDVRAKTYRLQQASPDRRQCLRPFAIAF